MEHIWRYTADSWSLDQADRYLTDLFDAFAGLAAGERIGRDANDIRPGYLKYAVGRHLVFYLENDGRLTIIRVLHQRMDIDAHLDDA